MKKLALYNIEGEKTGKINLPVIFNIKPNLKFIAQVYKIYQKKQAPIGGHTKNRGQVRGGGAKPWRQKGTGRARAGSIRSPLWKGGGVIFGPKTQIKKYHLLLKERRAAILQIFANYIKEDKLIVVSRIKLNEYKTKKIINFLESLPVENNILIILDQPDKKILKSFANIPYAKAITLAGLNFLKILNKDFIIITKKAFELLTKRYER